MKGAARAVLHYPTVIFIGTAFDGLSFTPLQSDVTVLYKTSRGNEVPKKEEEDKMAVGRPSYCKSPRRDIEMLERGDGHELLPTLGAIAL